MAMELNLAHGYVLASWTFESRIGASDKSHDVNKILNTNNVIQQNCVLDADQLIASCHAWDDHPSLHFIGSKVVHSSKDGCNVL